MKRTTLKSIVGFQLIVCLCLGFAWAQEEKEQKTRLKNLPPAVQKTVQEQSQGAKIRGLSKEKEDGKTVYELELLVNGHTKDMIIDEAGKVLIVEEAVTLASLPPNIKAAVEKNAGKGKIFLIETVIKDNALAFYEVHLKTGQKKSEFEIDLQGNLIPAANKK